MKNNIMSRNLTMNDNKSDAEILRQKAEEALRKKKSAKAGTHLSEAEALKLFHEFEVHEIELEMINEELILAKEKAEDASEKYTELYDFSPSGYFTFSRTGEILEINLTGAKMLGRERKGLKNLGFASFLSANTKSVFKLFLDRVFNSNEKKSCEVALINDDEITGYVLLTGVVSENREQCLVTAVDIMKIKTIQNELAESNHFNLQIINSALEGIIVYDRSLKYQVWNPFMEKFSGIPAPEVLGKRPMDLFPFLEAGGIIENLKKALSGETVAEVDFPFDIPASGKSGWSSDTTAPLLNSEGEIVGAISTVRDITERKHTENLISLQNKVLKVLASDFSAEQITNELVEVIQQSAGYDVVGVRLRKGFDYPFVASVGYSKEFLKAENTLTQRYPDGGLCKNADGTISLECTCGLVLTGKTDPNNPLFTPDGSAWTNNSLPLLDIPPDADPRLHPRNRCIHVGFLSLALIPIRAGEEIIGLLHLGDRQKDRFTLEIIQYYEGIGISIGAVLARKQSEEELTEKMDEMQRLFNLTVDRELTMIGLKKEVNELLKNAGREEKYTIV